MAPSLAEVEVVLRACSHQVALCCSVSSPAPVGGTGGAGMSQQPGCVRFASPRRPAERRRWMRAAAFPRQSITRTLKGLLVVDCG